MNILFLSTPVGPLGSGLGGGVELTLKNLAIALAQRNHRITILAPEASQLDTANLPISIVTVPGQLQDTAQTQGRETPILMPSQSALAAMVQQAQQRQTEHDIIINFAYDWLPFYLTSWFDIPIAHLVSMGSLTNAMDDIVQQVISRYPKRIGVHSQAQANTFSFGDRCRVLGNGLDLSQYTFQPQPNHQLAWVGRIAPEKGIEDAIAAVQTVGIALKIFGVMPDPDYWQDICQRYPNAPITYEGFLSTDDLQNALGQCQGLIMTPKWIEAFGNVAIEALACGVPVISYRRGGPSEIIDHGKTGWLVDPDNVDGLVESIGQIKQLQRQDCRHQAERHYSLQAMGNRVEHWLHDILA